MPRGVVLCLGIDVETVRVQVRQAMAAGNAVLAVAADAMAGLPGLAVASGRLRVFDGQIAADDLTGLRGIDAVACRAQRAVLSALRAALARRSGALIPLITEVEAPERYVLERHLCIDTAAAGGNASLLAVAGG